MPRNPFLLKFIMRGENEVPHSVQVLNTDARKALPLRTLGRGDLSRLATPCIEVAERCISSQVLVDPTPTELMTARDCQGLDGW